MHLHKALTRLAIYPGVPIIERMKADGLLIDRGLKLEYKFKDPMVRALDRTLHTLGSCSDFMRRLRGTENK